MNGCEIRCTAIAAFVCAVLASGVVAGQQAAPVPPASERVGAEPGPSTVSQERAAAWSWKLPRDPKQVSSNWGAALDAATKYVNGSKPRQTDALRLYQQVLDANPPREIELHVRLAMGARLTVLYNPDLGEGSLDAEALRWYELIVRDFKDWSNHHDLMVAKISLGDLCWGQYGKAAREKATDLNWQVIEVSEEGVVFDDPAMAHLNVDKIAVAKGQPGRRVDVNGQLITEPTEEMNQEHRKVLLQRRQEAVRRLRLAAVQALARMQAEVGSPETTLKRLTILKQKRADDQFYQESLVKIIEDFIKTHKGLQSVAPGPATGPATQPAANAAEIERLIRQLGSDKFAERDAAQKELVKIGRAAEPQLLTAAKDADRERSSRAAIALQEIEAAGLQVRLTSVEPLWIPGDTPRVRLEVRNISDQAIRLLPLMHRGKFLKVSFRVRLLGEAAAGRDCGGSQAVPADWTGPEPAELAPGAAASVENMVMPSPDGADASKPWEVIAEYVTPRGKIITVAVPIRFRDLTKATFAELIALQGVDYPGQLSVSRETAQRLGLKWEISTGRFEGCRSPAGRYSVMFRHSNFDGRGTPTSAGDRVVLVDAAGKALWAKDIKFAGFPAVADNGTVAVPEWLERPWRIEMVLFDIQGRQIASYGPKPTKEFMDRYRPENGFRNQTFGIVFARGFSPDGKRLYFATIGEHDLPRMYCMDATGLLWQQPLDKGLSGRVDICLLRVRADGRFILLADTLTSPSQGFAVFSTDGKLVLRGKETGEFTFEGDGVKVKTGAGVKTFDLPAPAALQATPPSTQPAAGAAAEIDRLIRQLASDKFGERDAAQQALVKIGRPAVEALQSVTADKDAERSQRAKAALKLILPDTTRPGAIAGLAVQNFVLDPRKLTGSLAPSCGALVKSVAQGSSAAKVGLAEGDVVTAVNGLPVATAAELRVAIGRLAPGGKAALTVWRSSRVMSLVAPVDEWPASDPQQMRAYRLENAHAVVLAPTLEKALRNPRQPSAIAVLADVAANAVIVIAPDSAQAEIAKLIWKLDTPAAVAARARFDGPVIRANEEQQRAVMKLIEELDRQEANTAPQPPGAGP